MEKIIVNPRDHKSPEVFHNDGIMHGMYSKDYKVLVEKEQKIAHRLLDIALTGELPEIAKIALKERNDEGDKKWVDDVQVVCQKVVYLMAQGFHAKIVIGMIRCATGGGGGLSYEFQLRFDAAMNKEIRLDFWGTEKRVPLVMVEDILVDLFERNINIDKPTKEDIKKSWLYEEFVTHFKAF